MQTYRIHRFSKLTGLSTHVIRAWERRYGLVNPTRSANRYRLYSDEDVQLFRYLKSQVDQGVAIGELADIGRDELLVRAHRAVLNVPQETPPSEGLVLELTQALQANDMAGFERQLNGALAVIPFEEALLRFVLPLQEKVGELWHDGVLSTGQEHFASNQVKQKIFSAMNQFRNGEAKIKLVVACPADERHEISAMTVAYLCSARGCSVDYLGANLPTVDLEKYCQQIKPRYVLLSLTNQRTVPEVRTFSQELAARIVPVAPVGVGGQCAQLHAAIFSELGISVFPDLKALDALVFSLSY